MYLYNLTLQHATSITHAIHGNFSGSNHQEILISRGKVLELLRLIPSIGKIETVLTVEIFGIIRSLSSFRFADSTKDYIIVGSDSGQIIILEYCTQKNVFEKVYQETFGKSGCRRSTPGQYLAVDPCGRAIMISAVENEKLVYVTSRDEEARISLSSPLEAHKKNTFIYHSVGVDVDVDSIMFACLEMDYEEANSDTTKIATRKTKQTITFYEVNVDSNHVECKSSESVEERANYLVPVPGGEDGPGGILICSENNIMYKNLGDQINIRCPIPRRRNDLDGPQRGRIIVCAATHKTESMFFFLIQTEQGDIFKITLETDCCIVKSIHMKYFDTVPVASAMCILKTGFLFIATEFGNHYLYQFVQLGDDDEPLFSSEVHLEKRETFFFVPRFLRNLILVDELYSLSPIMASQVTDSANEDTSQLNILCGRGPRSTVRILRHGLEVSEVSVAELPGNPTAVWTVKHQVEDKFDAYIIVSFTNATLVFLIGETIEEVMDSGFLGTTTTLFCSSLGDDSVVQVYPHGLRHIQADKTINDWPVSGKKIITKCTINQRQVMVALTGGELIYFELDPDGQLKENTEHKELLSEVICMALASVPQGELRTHFLAVCLADKTLQIIRLDPSDFLTPLIVQMLPTVAESLCIVEMGAGKSQDEDNDTQDYLYLNIGLQSGHLLQTIIDQSTGNLSDASTHYLGSWPVKLFRICIQGKEAVLALSSRSWLSYYYQTRVRLTPLLYDPLEYASGFSAALCPEGIVAVSSNTLRIVALEKLGTVFNQVPFPLDYTPRKFVIHQESGRMIIVETDHNAYTEETKKQRRLQVVEEMQETAGEDEQELVKELAEAFLNENLPENMFGAPKAGPGMWASVVRILDPGEGRTVDLVKFEQNEAVLSITLVNFAIQPDEMFVIVGIVKDYQFNTRQESGGFLYTFRVDAECSGLELLHRTPVEGPAHCLCAFQGHLLVGVGNILRLYDLGKKKLLRKCENTKIPNLIVDIQAIKQRVYVSDAQNGIYIICYKPIETQLIIFADDINPRKITTSAILDYDTIATADKFGNIAVLRLSASISDEIDKYPEDKKEFSDKGLLRGASQKASLVAHFYLGEMCTSLQKATLISGGCESLVYTTLSGTVGLLVPFTSHEDQEFFQHLEMDMRCENPPLSGREHLNFRSYYYPVKNIIDGDLCEQFSTMDSGKQKSIAADLDSNPSQVVKKLEDIRNHYAF